MDFGRIESSKCPQRICAMPREHLANTGAPVYANEGNPDLGRYPY
jgi:hypothetical protein